MSKKKAKKDKPWHWPYQRMSDGPEYDADADAIYIRLREGKVSKTIEKDHNFLLDIDDKGHLLGMEILNLRHLAAQNFPKDKRKCLGTCCS